MWVVTNEFTDRIDYRDDGCRSGFPKEHVMKAQNVCLRFSKWMFVACGVWLVGLAGYFLFVRPPLLPEDLRYMGASAPQVDSLMPHLAAWLRNVFTVMGGFMAGCGVLLVFVAVRVMPQCLQGTGVVLACTGLLTVATMSWTNLMLDSDFKWLLLVPAIAWLLAFVSYKIGSTPVHPIAAVRQTKQGGRR
jgi:hypothetical protein